MISALERRQDLLSERCREPSGVRYENASNLQFRFIVGVLHDRLGATQLRKTGASKGRRSGKITLLSSPPHDTAMSQECRGSCVEECRRQVFSSGSDHRPVL